MIKLIIFDFSGTLGYIGDLNLRDFFGKLREYGVKVRTEKETEYFFDFLPSFFDQAKNWLEFSQMMAEKFDNKPSKENLKELKKYLKKKLSFRLYDDVEHTIDLPQKKAILTSTNRFLIRNLPALKTFDIFTPRDIRYEKPDKKAFETVLRKMNIIANEAVMVGDNLDKDLYPARALGMQAILIDRKNKIKEKSFKDFFIKKISSLKELKNLL